MDVRVAGRRVDVVREELMAFSLSRIVLLLSGSDVVSSAMMNQGWVTGFIGVGDMGRKGGRRSRREERRMA